MSRSALLAVVGLVLGSSGLQGQAPPAAGTPGFQAFVFGDFLYTATDPDDDSDGFHLGQMVVHGNAVLTDRVLFFGEVSLTGRDDGYGIEVERAILRYEFSDALKLSAGRFHTAVSYWNTAFHHGLWLQGSVARPEAVRFGSRFIPVHFVGAQAEGHIPASPVHWVLAVGNGRADNIARAGDAGDANGSRAFLASASARPARLPGVQVGGALYLDRVPTPGPAHADERIMSGHLAWERGAVDVIGEYIRVHHEDVVSGDGTSSDAWYVHLGVRLPDELSPLTPYVRAEHMDISEADAVFEGQVADFEAVVAGVRYDFSDLSALKLEYRRQELDGGDALDGLYVQASFAIPILGG